jgi:hypothetical protein
MGDGAVMGFSKQNPFVSSEVETRLRGRSSTSLEANGKGRIVE